MMVEHLCDRFFLLLPRRARGRDLPASAHSVFSPRHETNNPAKESPLFSTTVLPLFAGGNESRRNVLRFM